MAVLALVRLGQVLGPSLQVVVRVVDVFRNQMQHPVAEVLQGALLPLVDQQGARGMRTEGDDRPVRDARVLDGSLQFLGQIEVGVSRGRRHLDRDGRCLHEALLVSVPVAGATGRSKVNTLPFPTSLSARMRPPCASTTDRAMARPMPVPPASRARAVSTL